MLVLIQVETIPLALLPTTSQGFIPFVSVIWVLHTNANEQQLTNAND